MASHEQAIECAITLIERFLARRSHADAPPAPELLHRISLAMEVAQSVRDQSVRSAASPLPVALSVRYRECLEQLRDRLATLESTLCDERNRLLQEESHLARARQWHALLGRTQ